jgi:hypothetical protein
VSSLLNQMTMVPGDLTLEWVDNGKHNTLRAKVRDVILENHADYDTIHSAYLDSAKMFRQSERYTLEFQIDDQGKYAKVTTRKIDDPYEQRNKVCVDIPKPVTFKRIEKARVQCGAPEEVEFYVENNDDFSTITFEWKGGMENG